MVDKKKSTARKKTPGKAPTTPFGLGRHEALDPRDAEYGIDRARLGFSPYSYGLWRYHRPGPVLDQGRTAHCVAFAWKQYLQTSPIRQATGMHEDFIYELAQVRDEWPGEAYDGTSVRAGAKVLSRLGFIGSYIWLQDTAEIKQWILTKGPVVLGTTWYTSMFSPDENGFVSPQGTVAGGHAYTAVGYSFLRKAFRFVNSWGGGWGQNGRFWIKESDIATLLQNGEACGATEERL